MDTKKSILFTVLALIPATIIFALTFIIVPKMKDKNILPEEQEENFSGEMGGLGNLGNDLQELSGQQKGQILFDHTPLAIAEDIVMGEYQSETLQAEAAPISVETLPETPVVESEANSKPEDEALEADPTDSKKEEIKNTEEKTEENKEENKNSQEAAPEAEPQTEDAGTSIDAEKCIYVDRGTMLYIVEMQDGKYLVKYEENCYYVEKKYVKLVEAFDKALLEKKVIVIDAGHQAKANSDPEPIGPGASEKKNKVKGGTKGKTQTESELTLDIALLLQPELEKRGYLVLQVRDSQDVDISNSERSKIANNVNADVLIRLHANGSDDSSVNGAQTICPAKDNPYPIKELYDSCRRLATCVLDKYVESTGCRKEFVSERNDLSGNNWSEVPVAILEMGYMTNAEEDQKMQNLEYREKMVQGIANGIDFYFE